MAIRDQSTLLANIDATITNNNRRRIRGSTMNTVLSDIVDTMYGDGTIGGGGGSGGGAIAANGGLYITATTGNLYLASTSGAIYVGAYTVPQTVGDSGKVLVSNGTNVVFGDAEATSVGTLDSLQLSSSASTPSHSEGLLFYDQDDKCVAYYNNENDTTIQVGQETVILATNKTGVQINNGQLVYINDAQGNRPTIALAKADAAATAGCIGMATHNIPNNNSGFITIHGLVRGLVTHTYNEGDKLYLSAATAGDFTDSSPSAPNFPICIGTVVKSDNGGGIVLLSIDPGNVTNHMVIENVTVNNDFKTRGDIEYVDTFWEDLRFPISSLKVGPSNNPGFGKVIDNGSGSTGVFSYLFDGGGEEMVHFAAQMPHSWKQETDITAHVHWMPTTDMGTGQVVRWGLEYTWVDLGETASNTTIIYGTGQMGPIGTPVTNDHILTPLGTISGSGHTGVSSMLLCRLFRDGAGDSYADDAALIEADFHYEIDSPGSSDEYVK